MVNRKTWQEFKDTGMLWFANMILHAFGWSIVCDTEDGEVVNAYPAWVKFRGFTEQINSDGYIKLSQYMIDNAETLLKESKS